MFTDRRATVGIVCFGVPEHELEVFDVSLSITILSLIQSKPDGGNIDRFGHHTCVILTKSNRY